MKNNTIHITWYGRCCFLLEINTTKILIDPYDTFDGVDLGYIKSDYTLISSTWHDHGNISASPHSIIISEPGKHILKDDITITGIETKENRGTRNVIFNISFKDFSITNFADLGDKDFLKQLDKTSKKILETTNIAFARPNKVLETSFTSIDLALSSCSPKILIPHHFYPLSFTKQIPGNFKENILNHWEKIKTTFSSLSKYKQKMIPSDTISINLSEYNNTLLLFEKMHTQVRPIKNYSI